MQTYFYISKIMVESQEMRGFQATHFSWVDPLTMGECRAFFSDVVLEVDMQIVTKNEAVRRGLKKYFTGEPCSRGHIAERYFRNGACLECMKENLAKSRGRDAAQIAAVGVVGIRVSCHHSDVETVLAFARALRLQRGLP